jgi:flavodoxin
MKRFCSGLAVLSIIGTVYFAADIGGSASAAEKSGLAVKKKILVVYYSRSGNTKKVSEDLAKRLGADIEQIVDKKDRSGTGGYFIAGKDAMMGNLADIEPLKKDPAQYDLVIIGTPIWSWDMTPAVRTYLSEKKNSFKEIAFFTTSGSTKQNKTVKNMETLAGKSAKASAGFVESDLKESNRARYEELMTQFAATITK